MQRHVFLLTSMKLDRRVNQGNSRDMEFFKQTWVKILIVAILVLGAGITVTYWLGTKKNQPIPSNPITTGLKGTQLSPTIVQPSPTPLPTDSEQVGSTAIWKTYHSNKGGYSVQIPFSWEVRKFSDSASAEDAAANIDIFPESSSGIPLYSLSIRPDQLTGNKGLEGLQAQFDQYPAAWFVKRETSFTQVANFRAMVKVAVWEPTPPKGFAGEWYNRTEKNVYVDFGNSKLLIFYAKWDNVKLEYEKLFDQVIYSLKLDR